MTFDRTGWISELEFELKHNILHFWMTHAVDEDNGGFYGYISRDLQINRDADKSLVLNTRILWTFAAAYRLYKDERYLTIADRAYAYIDKAFRDEQFGGYYWSVDKDGQPSDTKKQIYGQAFAIYAFTEYYRATGKGEARDLALELFQTLERHSYDPVDKGYVEALTRDWQETDRNSLSEKDLNSKKSMNTHLHVMEAYTNLRRISDSAAVRDKLKEIIEVTLDHIVDSRHHRFMLFFDMKWNSQSSHISYGHDIEGSWLLVEAAEILGDESLLERVKQAALHMAQAVLDNGTDKDGGLFNEADHNGLLDSNKDWWPQAEAVVGYYNAYQLTGNEPFLEAATRAWTFIREFLVDRTYGEWYWSVARDGKPTDKPDKVSAWKCPYHNSRACFEMIERLQANHLS